MSGRNNDATENSTSSDSCQVSCDTDLDQPLEEGAVREFNTGVFKKPAPGLYIVATPIGNAGDITLRALNLLKNADTVYCEDTRVTQKLLSLHSISRSLQSYHEHNGERMRPKIIQRLNNGESVALVSDAGTPLINDPGYKLVRECYELGLPVSGLPGPSSVIAALVLSGLPSDRFLYGGFLPPKSGQRKTTLEEFSQLRATLIFLESPRRLEAMLIDVHDVLGDREVAVTRELTKKFEEVRRAPVAELIRQYGSEEPPRGEVVVVIGPPRQEDLIAKVEEDLDSLLEKALKAEGSLRDAVASVVKQTGLAKKRVYNRALELSKE